MRLVTSLILAAHMRRTKIVATVGPASRSPEQLERLVLAGVNVFRLNFSHGTHEEHLAVIGSVRDIAARLHRPIALLQDLSGPKIRTGKVRDGVLLRNGARIAITTDTSVEGGPELISTTYEALPRDVKPGDRVLLDDGNLELRVTGIAAGRVDVRGGGRRAAALEQGHEPARVSRSRRRRSPRRTARDLAFGVEHGVDFVALSFVRPPQDVEQAKQLLDRAASRTPGDRQDREAAGASTTSRRSWSWRTGSWWRAATSASSSAPRRCRSSRSGSSAAANRRRASP